jgi:HEPN domain-containing protein
MKPETQEWFDKAVGDWKVARREIRTKSLVWNVVCFLAEQCAEKYLKGFLEENNIAFRKTHDLVVLLNASGGWLPELDPLKPELAQLSTFGLATRYPGAQADRSATKEAMKTAETVRSIIRTKLGISS